MSVTPEIEADILRRYDQNPQRFSPFRVAKQVGATMSEVLSVVKKNKDRIPAGEELGLVARGDLEPYIVASRHASSGSWNNEDVGVARARRLFCEGTHTMATHREGAWLHLCLFPLRRPVKPRPTYFDGGKF